jgi:pyrroline-5-carboxylate reductase
VKIAFIGAGNMAGAIIGGVLRAGLCQPEEVTASDVDPERRRRVQALYGIRVTADNTEAAGAASTVVLAVKPQNLEAVGKDLLGNLSHDPLIISILAGASIAKIRFHLGQSLRVVRVMPNLPALVGCGMSAMASAAEVTAEDAAGARSILETVGEVVELPEELLDAVTALSGSGPGFVYRLMEAFAAAGEAVGLGRSMSEQLTAQTFLGAAKLLRETGEKAAELRARVSSPGGTTLAGLEVMEQTGIDELIRAGVTRARDRARELGA